MHYTLWRLQINKTVLYQYMKDKVYPWTWIKGAMRTFFLAWQNKFLFPDRFDWIVSWGIWKQEKVICFANWKTLKHFLPLNHCAHSQSSPYLRTSEIQIVQAKCHFQLYKQLLVCGVRMDILPHAAVLLIRLWLQYSQWHNCIFVMILLIRGSMSNSVTSLAVSVQTSLTAPLIFRVIPNLEAQSHGRISQHPSFRHETLWPALSNKRFQGAGNI